MIEIKNNIKIYFYIIIIIKIKVIIINYVKNIN